jgi:hypothetical protein
MKRLLAIACLAAMAYSGHAQNALSSDIKDFKAGNTKAYVTKGHEKAEGISLQVKYPAAWITKESTIRM